MITTSLENSALWQPIEHWQHRACVSTLIKLMTDEGYKPKSICSTNPDHRRFHPMDE